MAAYVYILASKRNGTLYIGVTTDLVRRVFEHRNGFVPGFTSAYGVGRLVYFEMFCDVRDAIAREKAMKKWNRDWRLKRIETQNPQWLDLFDSIAS